jgi:hypothetical protein
VTCGSFLGNGFGKYVAMERLILGNLQVTENGFNGYENWRRMTALAKASSNCK